MPRILNLTTQNFNPRSNYIAFYMKVIVLAFVLGLVLILSVFIRLIFILPAFRRRKPLPRKHGTPTFLLVVLGSGGHTGEMLMLLSKLDPTRYTHRRYVVSSGDVFSMRAAEEFEEQRAGSAQLRGDECGIYDIKEVPRARKIHQSLITTPFSALRCLTACIFLLRQNPPTLAGQSQRDQARRPRPYPDLILTNGPATATIMIAASLMWRLIPMAETAHSMRCIYVESWARVRTLSLSGKILMMGGMCERFLVQWAPLSEANQRAEFIGQLVS